MYGTELKGSLGQLLDNSVVRRLDAIADRCRQLARALRNLAREITSEEGELVSGLLGGLDRYLAEVRLARGN